MISWKTLRTICLVLLLMPLVHLVYLVSRDTVASLDGSPEAWATEVDAYAREDRTSKLPENPIVVVGGRRVKLWSGLEELLAPRDVLMRGVGEATVDDLIYHYDRLIAFYQPDTVVLLPGNSEFHIRANKDAESLVRGIKELVTLGKSLAATRRFYVITPIKTPLYTADVEVINKTRTLLKAWAKSDDRVQILDADALLCHADGSPNPAYYRADGVNLNEHGYLRLSVMLQSTLENDLPAG